MGLLREAQPRPMMKALFVLVMNVISYITALLSLRAEMGLFALAASVTSLLRALTRLVRRMSLVVLVMNATS